MVSKALSTFIGDAILSCDVASLYLLDENFLTYHSPHQHQLVSLFIHPHRDSLL